ALFRPQRPPRGGARAELPGGDQQPRVPSWSDENARPQVPPRPAHDAPRGHDEPDVTRRAAMPRIDGPGADPQHTGQFARPGTNGGQNTGQLERPGADGGQNSGPYVRGDVFGGPADQQGRPNPSQTGQLPAPQGYDDASTGQLPAPRPRGGAPRRHALPARHGAADPATGPGDGRTPLYDTLETNWFRGGGRQQQEQGDAPAPAAPQQQPQGPTGPQRSEATSWRSSPNDELVRQAERVRQPAAGGVTT